MAMKGQQLFTGNPYPSTHSKSEVSMIRERLLCQATEGIQLRGFFRSNPITTMMCIGSPNAQSKVKCQNSEESKAAIAFYMKSGLLGSQEEDKRQTRSKKFPIKQSQNLLGDGQSYIDLNMIQSCHLQQSNQSCSNDLHGPIYPKNQNIGIQEDDKLTRKQRCMRGANCLQKMADQLIIREKNVKPTQQKQTTPSKGKIIGLQFHSDRGQILEKIIEQDPCFSSPNGKAYQYDCFSQAFDQWTGSQEREEFPSWGSAGKSSHSSNSTQKTSLGFQQTIPEIQIEEENEWSPESVDEGIILRYTRLLKEQELLEQRVHTEGNFSDYEKLQRRSSSSKYL